MMFLANVIDEFFERFAALLGLDNNYAGGPKFELLVVSIYLLLVLKVGPMGMQNRAPLQLTRVLRFYNIFNVAANCVLFAFTIYQFNFGLRCFSCEPMDFHSHNLDVFCAKFYYWLKIIDLLDTVFMVLRKKSRQISVLHVVHHAAMPLLCWMSHKTYFRPPPQMLILLNTLAHIFMYAYYYLASSESNKRNLWFKKYITLYQITQFNILFAVYAFVVSQCLKNSLQIVFSLCGSIPLLYFDIAFIQFYVRNYVNASKQ